MEDLLSVMQILDRNSNTIPEGDYLELCNLLKKAYNQRADPVYFFDYENFSTLPIGLTEYELQYFYDYYFDKALNFDSDFIRGQIQYLRKELCQCQPIQRNSKTIRDDVAMHYFHMYNVDIENIDSTVRKKQMESLCKSYIQIENNFREKYRDTIEKKIEWLEQGDDRLDGM